MLKSGYALWVEMRGIRLSPAARIEMLQQLLRTEYIDEDGNLVKCEPLMTREQALQLIDWPKV